MTGHPAPNMVQTWAGWIPTVSGQLSFSIIGHSSAAKNCAFVNEAHSGDETAAPVRHLVLHQRRTAPDFPYPDFLTKWFYPGSVYDFVCVAQTEQAEIQVMLPRNAEGEPRVKSVPNAQGVLKGKIHVLLHETQKALRTKNWASIQRLKATIWQTDAENIAARSMVIARTLAGDNLPPEFGHIPSLLAADFELYRTGEFRLTIDQTKWLEMIDEREIDEALKTIPNQIFYFMKDVVHRHYHHDGSSDQMLALTRLNGASATDEINWRRSTLWGLVRVIMQYRRAGRWLDLQKAKGVIAYAEAFQHSFAHCIRMPFGPLRFKPSSELGTYDFKHIRDSIEVSIAENTAQRSVFWQGVALALPLLLAIFIALSSFGSKVLAQQLAACGSAGDGDFLSGLRAKLGCDEVAASSMTFWETLTTEHTVAMIVGLLVVVAIFAEHYLLDIPLARSWFGRKLHSIRSTYELLNLALHTQILMAFRFTFPAVRNALSQIPLALLIAVFTGQIFLLIWLLRLL